MEVGKYVRVKSNASYKHYKKIGRIVGNCEGNHNMVYVYFEGDKDKTRFYEDSLELLN